MLSHMALVSETARNCNLSNREIISTQKVLGSFYAACNNVLINRGVHRFSETCLDLREAYACYARQLCQMQIAFQVLFNELQDAHQLLLAQSSPFAGFDSKGTVT